MHLAKPTIIAAVLLLSACASKHQFVRGTSDQGEQAMKLKATDSIAITQPPDGIHGHETYRGSGALTARVLASAFARHAESVKLGPYAHSVDEALAVARQLGQRYLIHPTIIRWENGITELSSFKDKVDIKIAVIETSTGLTVSSSVLSSTSGVVEYLHGGPPVLLQQSVEQFVASLY